MAPIVNQVLEEVIKSCNSDQGITQVLEKEQQPEMKQFSLDSDSEDSDADVKGIDVDVNFIDEKSAAIHAIGNLFLYCPGALVDSLQGILGALNELSFYFHANIRYHVCMTYT